MHAMAYRRGTRPYGDEYTINDRLRWMARINQKVHENSLAALEKWHEQPKLPVSSITAQVPDVTSRVPNVTPQEDTQVPTTLDDAFASVVELLSQTSRQCQRYYRSNPPHYEDHAACRHCTRFHGSRHTTSMRGDRTACCYCNCVHLPQYTANRNGNALQKSEDVHLVVPPGKYTVTAGRQGTSKHRSHVVHVRDKESVELDFVL